MGRGTGLTRAPSLTFAPVGLFIRAGIIQQHMSDFDSLSCLLSGCAVKCIRMGGASVKINRGGLLRSLTFDLFFFLQTDHKTAQRNLLPVGRIIWDHAVHPGCWLCLLPGAFSSVQTVSEVDPGAAVERARCRHRVRQVRR